MPIAATRRFVLGTALATAGAASAGRLLQASTGEADPYAGAPIVGAGRSTTVLDVTDPTFGAKGDGVVLGDLVVRAGSSLITSATGPFVSTQRDRGKLVLWLSAGGRVAFGTIASVRSPNDAVMEVPAESDSAADGGPNTNAAVGTDNTAALNAAFAAAQAATARAAPDRREQVPTVQVHVPRGVFLLRPLHPFVEPGITVTGEGRFSSILAGASEGGWLQLGEYREGTADLYGGTAHDWTFRDLQFLNPACRNGSSEGRRTGRAIQDNGSGAVRIEGCQFTGLQVGLCSAYGSDFSSVRDSTFYICDIGYYFGPGSQQLDIAKTDASQCGEGAVFEGAPQWHIGSGSSFEDPSIAAITIEAPASGRSRFGVPVDAGGAFYSGVFLIDGATWFETNSGGNGRTAPRLIWMHGDGPYGIPAAGLVVRDAYVVAGGEQQPDGTASFVEYESSGSSPEPVVIDGLTIGGTQLNAVFRMSGSAATSSPRLQAVTKPDAVAMTLGPASGAKIIERDGSFTWAARFRSPAPDAPALTVERSGGTNAPLLAARTPEDDIVRSGIASGGALLEAFTSVDSSGEAIEIDASRANHAACALTGGSVRLSIVGAPDTSQRLTVELIARGAARSVRWPSDCRFAGGGGPGRVEAETRTLVTFVWNPNERLWVEAARAETVGL